MISNHSIKYMCGMAVGVIAFTSACSVHINSSIKTGSNETIQHDLKTVNGSIKVAEGSVVEGVCKTVNGSVELGPGARAEGLKTVNGSIKIKSEATVEDDVETVNGRISAEGGNHIGGNIKTVNGGLELGSGVKVQGDVTLVNGAIKFTSALVEGDVIFRNGDVHFSGETQLLGDLILEGTKKRSNNNGPIEIRLGDQTVIHGSILVEDKEREVLLYVTGDARVEGTIEGLTVVEE